MDKRRRRLMIISGILLCALLQRIYANPNHLEPIPSYDDTGYSQAVFESLIGKKQPVLWMIERPSFSREYAVILRHEIEYDPNDPGFNPVRKVKREQWLIEYAVPKEMIWRWKPIGDGSEVLDIKRTDDVETRRTAVTKDFAATLKEAWLSVLVLTRYSDGAWGGLDGTTLQFCVHNYFGETWSPTTGLPAMLTDLGHKLRALALSDEKNRGPLLKEAENLARTIAREGKAEQEKIFGKRRE